MTFGRHIFRHLTEDGLRVTLALQVLRPLLTYRHVITDVTVSRSADSQLLMAILNNIWPPARSRTSYTVTYRNMWNIRSGHHNASDSYIRTMYIVINLAQHSSYGGIELGFNLNKLIEDKQWYVVNVNSPSIALLQNIYWIPHRFTKMGHIQNNPTMHNKRGQHRRL